MSLFRRKSEILEDDRLSCCRVLEDSAYLLLITRREIELIIKAEAEIQFLPRKEAMQKTLAARQRIYTIAAKLSDTLYQLFFTFSEEDNSYYISPTIPTAAFSLLKELELLLIISFVEQIFLTTAWNHKLIKESPLFSATMKHNDSSVSQMNMRQRQENKYRS